MHRYFYKGLKFKITLLFCLVFMVINVIFSRVVYQNFKSAYVGNYNKYLYTRAQTIINRTEINPDLIALPDSGESIRVFYHNNARQLVTVFQSPGIISKLKTPYQTGIVDSLGQHGVYIKKEDFDGRPVELFLTVSNLPLMSKLANLSLLMMLATIGSVLVSSIAAYLTAGWLLRPIRSIVKQATQINSNQLDKRLDVAQTHDELQQLAETINAMIARIAHEQELQNNFFAAASHELRTPLAILQAETEMHLSNKGGETDKQLLTSQIQEINRLQQIVEQFLLISQFKHKGLIINKRSTDLSDQLLKVFARNRFAADRQQIKTTIHFGNNIQSFNIDGDSDKLEVVWQNLLQNALKHAPKQSIIICEIEQQGTGLEIIFKNTTAEEQVRTDNLTDAFTANQSLQAGSGLGLWLCKQIISAHNGSMAISAGDHTFNVLVTLPDR
ncbi:hypothetical protein A0256_06425 [Mucilaginibacter sp. PAMC 26640]|nr:hypothetical protein A0256_06425 [Mucilaginibacter sp. PAMC 26640]